MERGLGDFGDEVGGEPVAIVNHGFEADEEGIDLRSIDGRETRDGFGAERVELGEARDDDIELL